MDTLNSLADPSQLAGQARYGIDVSSSLGIGQPALRAVARQIGRDHRLARQLWESGVREARILASLVDDPGQVTDAQMESWAKDFSSWEVVDACCGRLFNRTPQAYEKALEWSSREEEFVKRAGFSLMCGLAVHDKKAPDDAFQPFFDAIEQQACDGRNFVKKAVNWALRQIGKRNLLLRERAIAVAERIAQKECRAAHWVAADALRELRSPQLEARLSARLQR
jgi:3-methyladenine DNA glycosylase AlkD